MAVASCSDEEFVTLFEKYGPAKVANLIGVSVTNVYARRRRLEERLDREIKCPEDSKNQTRLASEYEKRASTVIKDGIVIIGSDAHYWPGDASVAHRGLVKLCEATGKHLKAVILNGDVFDGAAASRHPRIGWAKAPSIKEELQAVDERLDEIRAASKGAELYWTLGNHDLRFESKLANQAGEYEGVKGVRLADHFPHWRMVWSLWINEAVVVKHRFKGGVHATHTNALWSGKTMVTGHLHSLKVCPFDDYNGTRWGVDTGTLNDPNGPHADYDEDNPKNHRSGFIVLTFRGGKLLWPEIAAVVDERRIQFRGELIRV